MEKCSDYLWNCSLGEHFEAYLLPLFQTSGVSSRHLSQSVGMSYLKSFFSLDWVVVVASHCLGIRFDLIVIVQPLFCMCHGCDTHDQFTGIGDTGCHCCVIEIFWKQEQLRRTRMCLFVFEYDTHNHTCNATFNRNILTTIWIWIVFPTNVQLCGMWYIYDKSTYGTTSTTRDT